MSAAPTPPPPNAVLSWARPVHETLRILRVRPGGPPPRVRGGQYISLGLELDGRLERRPFSASFPILGEGGRLLDPGREEALEFYVSHDESPFTGRLMELRPGDPLWLGRRAGGATTLDPVRPDDEVLFCATGTGEAPHNRMIAELLRAGHRGRIVSVVCCRYRRDLGYLEVHRRLEEMFDGYTYLPMTTREPGQEKRYIQDLIRSGELRRRSGLSLDPARTHVFLCGNAGMVGRPLEQDGRRTYPPGPGVVEILETGLGFVADGGDRTGNIHFERYT